MVGCYGLSDVYGPIAINDETEKSKVLECLSFYRLLDLPDETIQICYTDDQSIADGANKMMSDIREYIRYFTFEINDDQDQNTKPYVFNKKIFMAPLKEKSVQILTDECYVCNIANFMESLGKVGRDLTLLFDSLTTVKFEVLSILKIVEAKA